LPFRTGIVGAALVFVGVSAPLSSQERPDLTSPGNGARAAGMGGAITAASDDIFSIGWNPAGLSYLSRPEFGYSGRVSVVATGASAQDLQPTTYPRWVARGELTGTGDIFEFIGYAYPLQLMGRTITIAAAYRRFGEGLRAGRFESGTRLANGRYVGSTDFKSSPGIRAISPSIGIELTPRIRVGATANMLSGAYTHSVRGPFPYKYSAHEKDITGLALEAGALVQLTGGIRLGVHATLPHERSYTWDNDTTIRDVTREVPLAVAAGAQVRLDPKSNLTVDVRYAPWADSRLVNDADSSEITTFDGVNDAISFHVGYERDVTNEDRAASRRAGFFWKRTTIVDYLAQPITARGIAVGQSWTLPRSIVDASVNYQRSERWTRHRDAQRAITIRNQDVSIQVGVRRRYKAR